MPTADRKSRPGKSIAILLAVTAWTLSVRADDRKDASATIAPPRVVPGHNDWVWGVAVSPDGKRLVTAGGDSDHTAIVRDLATGDELRKLDVPGGARCAVFLTDDRRVLIASTKEAIYVGDTQDGSIEGTLTGHVGTVFDVAAAPDGKRAASVGQDWDRPALGRLE